MQPSEIVQQAEVSPIVGKKRPTALVCGLEEQADAYIDKRDEAAAAEKERKELKVDIEEVINLLAKELKRDGYETFRLASNETRCVDVRTKSNANKAFTKAIVTELMKLPKAHQAKLFTREEKVVYQPKPGLLAQLSKMALPPKVKKLVKDHLSDSLDVTVTGCE